MTRTETPLPMKVIAPDAGRAWWSFGQLAKVKAGADETHGRYTLVEILAPPFLVSMDEDWATVAQQMRHADIATTQRYYTHAMRLRRNGIAERLDATHSEFRVGFRVVRGSEGLVTGNTADAETRTGTEV